MKNLIFLLIAVFATNVAIAQTAVVNQVTDPGLTAIQTNAIDQTGDNYIEISQITSKELSHDAVAVQLGGSGNSIIVSQNAEGEIVMPDFNAVYAEQLEGNNNTINQTQIAGSWTSGGMLFTASQSGEGNTATQFSTRTNSEFEIIQRGLDNTALQETTGEKTGNLWAYIYQEGSSNTASQLHHGQNVRDDGAIIDQKGDGNAAIQEFRLLEGQPAWYAPNYAPSSADIYQDGFSNYAYQSQEGNGSYQLVEQTGECGSVEMYSKGNYNQAFAKQGGEAATMVITQTQESLGLVDEGFPEAGNVVRIEQDGIGGAVNILQNGMGNVVSGLDLDTYGQSLNGSVLSLTQTGANNILMLQQTNGGSAIVTQDGATNSSVIVQN